LLEALPQIRYVRILVGWLFVTWSRLTPIGQGQAYNPRKVGRVPTDKQDIRIEQA
jgi:hypothetical protein